MKATYKFFILHFSFFMGAALLPSLVAAQHITFESAEEYRNLGVYDTWEQSPFRTGVLNGSHYVRLVANPDMEENDAPGVATNASENALAVQRSRYGSNTFGARIDLNEPFCLGTSKKYVHVLIRKSADEGADVMLIGLGKRHDWEHQAPETEQFWVTASQSAQGQWNDLVFPITTNESVDIYSFVVVPDLASPHLRTADFVAYIDDIEVTDSPKPRYQSVDVLPTVEDERVLEQKEVRIYANQLNGDVLRTDNTPLSSASIPSGKAFTIKMVPAPGFTYTGIILTYGNGKSVTIPASAFDASKHEYTIPAVYIHGEVRIEGLFTPGAKDVNIKDGKKAAI